jgi:hypothetical protein
MTSIWIFVGLVVFALILVGGAYYVTKLYLEKKQANAYHLQQLAAKSDNTKASLHLRLQAYERLLLLCERISIPNLITRLRAEDATSNDLYFAMLIALQQELEHNVTQQMYVSENLWNIVRITHENVMEMINITAEKVDPKSNHLVLVKALFQFLSDHKSNPVATAQSAIRQEAATWM